MPQSRNQQPALEGDCGGLAPYEVWSEGNIGDRMAWAKAMLESLAMDYRALALDDRMDVKRALADCQKGETL